MGCAEYPGEGSKRGDTVGFEAVDAAERMFGKGEAAGSGVGGCLPRASWGAQNKAA